MGDETPEKLPSDVDIDQLLLELAGMDAGRRYEDRSAERSDDWSGQGQVEEEGWQGEELGGGFGEGPPQVADGRGEEKGWKRKRKRKKRKSDWEPEVRDTGGRLPTVPAAAKAAGRPLLRLVHGVGTCSHVMTCSALWKTVKRLGTAARLGVAGRSIRRAPLAVLCHAHPFNSCGRPCRLSTPHTNPFTYSRTYVTVPTPQHLRPPYATDRCPPTHDTHRNPHRCLPSETSSRSSSECGRARARVETGGPEGRGEGRVGVGAPQGIFGAEGVQVGAPSRAPFPTRICWTACSEIRGRALPSSRVILCDLLMHRRATIAAYCFFILPMVTCE